MKLNKQQGAVWLLALLLISSVSFWGFSRDEKNFEISKNLNIYYTLFRELNLFYVDEVDAGKLIKSSMDAMLKSLDPYTTYIPESEIEDFKLMTTGEYAGIGALISKHGDNVIISEPYEGFPAHKAGLRAGDELIKINNVNVENKSTSDVSNLLKGQANAPLLITIRRGNSTKKLEKKLIRENIQLKSVPYFGMINDSTGYIHLTQFTNKAAKEVRNALKELKEQNARAIVLDLRNNPGGLLDQAIEIVDMFVDKGENIVSTKGKVSKWDKVYNATKDPLDSEIKIAVLVNRGSASASEIVSGAIQDLDRGVIIGNRTFGKGLVQTTRNLTYNSKLKVTTAKYYIPSGRCIQAIDYSHRNDDGSVGTIADSLITEFKTKAGRKVYDGGGISPDLNIKLEMFSHLTISILRDFKIFDFATQYVIDHKSIESAKDFNIDENDYQLFKEYLKSHDFTYTSKSGEMLSKLKKLAKAEKFDITASEEIEALESKLTPNLDRDLKLFEKEIKELISHEICKRYYFQKGGILFGLKHDEVLDSAMVVLGNKKRYNKILKK